MAIFSRFLALVLAFGFLALLVGPAVADKDDDARIDKLIEQLGSPTFKERESATKALDAIGAPALEKLRKAADSDDLEVKRRARDLVKRIEKRAEVSRLLTPKRVHLVYKDTPLKEAVEDFKKKSGYDLAIHDPEKKLADRKVTLDTGDVTFLEAFDQFCDKAGIKQLTQQDMMQQMMEQMMKQRQEMMERMKNAAPPVRRPPAKDAPAKPPVKEEKPKGEAKKEDKRAAADKAKVERAVRLAEAERLVAVVQAQAAAPGLARPGVMIAPGSRGMPTFSPHQILLTDGKRKPLPTCYAGTIRIRAAEPMPLFGGNEAPLVVNLDVATEPKLQLQSVTNVRITKAVDDKDQTLQMAAGADHDVWLGGPNGARMIFRGGGGMTMPYLPGASNASIPLKKGEKVSKKLKELSGTLTIQALDAPQAVITVDNILKAGGTTTKGKAGGRIKVVEATKTEDGHVKLQVELDVPPDVTPAMTAGFGGPRMSMPMMRAVPAAPAVAPPPPVAKPKEKPAEKPKEEKPAAKAPAKDKPVAVPPPPVAAPAVAAAPAFVAIETAVAQSAGNQFNGLSLVDDKGKSFPIVRVSASSRVAAAGAAETTLELTFEVKKDQGEPVKLIFSGSKSVTVEVPFILKDVPCGEPGGVKP